MRRSLLRYTVIYGFLLISTLYALVPIVWGLSTSFKTPAQINAIPPVWIPDPVYFGHYLSGVFEPRFMRFVLNTIVVIAGTMLISLLLSAHAAHAVVRRQFRMKEALLFLMWATIMIPGVAIIVPLYLISIDIGLYDTLTILVLVYSSWLVPTLVWLLQSFIANIPVELEESARIDGCSPIGAFYRITLPLTRPGLLAGSVLVFVMVWNEFLIGYSLVLGDAHRIIQVGVYSFITDRGVEWGPLMAASIGSILPVIVMYGFMQKAFIQGLGSGAVKG